LFYPSALSKERRLHYAHEHYVDRDGLNDLHHQHQQLLEQEDLKRKGIEEVYRDFLNVLTIKTSLTIPIT